MITTLIVASQSLVRQGLEIFLSEDEVIKVIGTAANAQEALQRGFELKPDLVLIDISEPKMEGIEVTALLKHKLPTVRVVILTDKLDLATLIRTVEARADGYIQMNIDKAGLCLTIKTAMTGHFLLSREAIYLLLGGTGSPQKPKPRSVLTARELEVLKFLAAGKPNKVIAKELALSEGTIKTHVSIIMSKLGLQSRTQAAFYAKNAGLL